MPKPTKEELIAAMKDPELLKAAGLVPADDKEEQELFADIEVDDDDTTADIVRKMNERTRKQREWYKKREQRILDQAKEETTKASKNEEQKRIDKFLKEHPEVNANDALLDEVELRYNKTGDLEEAYQLSCKFLGLDPATGKEPEKKEEEKNPPAKKEEKKSALKVDTLTPPADKVGSGGADEEDRPKTIREIASEHANALAASGKNPFRST